MSAGAGEVAARGVAPAGRRAPGRPPARDRRGELVRIAYRHIAERGFEGLRVREVAREAGMNSATLHHYFPTKEALIQGVVEHLLHEFSAGRAPRPAGQEGGPREALRQEFEDLRYRFRESPDLPAVLTELAARSRRDPEVARSLVRLHEPWREHLVGLLQGGVAAGAFRADLDPPAAATAIMAQMMGIGLAIMSRTDPGAVDRLITDLAAQVEHWLTGSRLR